MKIGTCRVSPALTALVLQGLLLLAQGATHAQVPYKIQPIVKVGDTVAGLRIASPLSTGGLNDQGQLAFSVARGTAGRALFVAGGGTLTPLVVSGQDAPGGKWPLTVNVAPLPSINQHGSVGFCNHITLGDQNSWGTFLWDARAQKLAPMALAGTPAVNNLSFLVLTDNSFAPIPAINNQDEIAFGGAVADTAGKPRIGVFFLGRDRVLRPVALPDQALPGGGTALQFGRNLALADTGAIAFQARRPGDGALAFSAYQWDYDSVTPLALVGGKAPGGGEITRVSAVRLNNRNRSVLLVLRVSTTPNQAGLYRLADGQLRAVAVPGQQTPGGGLLATILEEFTGSLGPNAISCVSQANEAGQFLFRARLEDGSRALYQLDPDGKLTLLLKQGMTTDLGEITHLLGEGGIGYNSRGQIALPLRIAGGPETLFLLTPTTP